MHYSGEKSPRFGKPSTFKGKHHSAETRKKMSELNKGKNHPFFGKHHSEKTRRKMSKALIGNKRQLGKHWYNNGVINKKFNENEIPEGFVRGTLRKGIKTGKNNIAGKKWYNNGITEVLTTECPTGFTEGRLKSISNKISNSKRGAV